MCDHVLASHQPCRALTVGRFEPTTCWTVTTRTMAGAKIIVGKAKAACLVTELRP